MIDLKFYRVTISTETSVLVPSTSEQAAGARIQAELEQANRNLAGAVSSIVRIEEVTLPDLVEDGAEF